MGIKNVALINLLAFVVVFGVFTNISGCSRIYNKSETINMSKPNAAKPGSKPQAADESGPVMGASRKAPPVVPPIVFEGVRYEQVMDALSMGYGQRTGYLAAYDEKDNRLLWMKKIYTIEFIEHLEQDVQDVFFMGMTLNQADRSITIENEIGGIYAIDIDKRSVQVVPVK